MSVASRVEIEPGRGVYDADRAAALAGVPCSTLHYWARKGLYTPSISAGPRVRLWSWADLLALRTIDWLRRAKGPGEPSRVSTRKIRQALDQLDRQGISREELHRLVAVLQHGQLVLEIGDAAMLARPGLQGRMPEMLPLVRPYQAAPDLLEPRPRLRIIPGKLHGEPHLAGTRISSATIFALDQLGYDRATIREMYPEAAAEAIDEAIEFERSLRCSRAA